MPLCEHLLTAIQSLELVCQDIQAAHAEADPVSELILSVHHENAVSLTDAMARLYNALESQNVAR